MILYADTSSLFKLYVTEPGSEDIRSSVSAAAQVATSVVAYAETRVALARALRDGRLTQADFTIARRKFEAEWPGIAGVEATDEILRESGDLGDIYPIRAFDAIHLASAKQVRAFGSEPVKFSTADRRLHEAALAAGFSV